VHAAIWDANAAEAFHAYPEVAQSARGRERLIRRPGRRSRRPLALQKGQIDETDECPERDASDARPFARPRPCIARIASPRQAWNSMRRWGILARHAGCPIRISCATGASCSMTATSGAPARCLERCPHVFSGLPTALCSHAGVQAPGSSWKQVSRAACRRRTFCARRGERHGDAALDRPAQRPGGLVLPADVNPAGSLPDALRRGGKLQIGDSRDVLPRSCIR